MPLVPRRQFGQEAAHGEGEGVAEQGLHLLEKAVAQEEPGGEEPPGQALAHGLRVGHHLRGDGEGAEDWVRVRGGWIRWKVTPSPAYSRFRHLARASRAPLVEA